MATTQELEELLVRMTGDASKYVKMLSDAQAKTTSSGQAIASSVDNTSVRVVTGIDKIGQHTNQYNQEVGKVSDSLKKLNLATSESSQKTQDLGKQLADVGKGMKEVGQRTLEAGEALSKLTGGFSLQDALNEFREAERSQRLLTAALEANGRNVQETTELYKDFATQMEQVTTFSADEVTALLRQAESLDVTGEAAKRAVRGALAIAEAQGKQAEQVVKATAALEKGSARAIGEYLPSLRAIQNQSERVAEAHRLLEREFKQVEAAVNTSSGGLKQLNNQWNNFKQSVGETIDTVLSPLTTILKEVVTLFQDMPEWVRSSTAVVLFLVAGIATLTVGLGAALVAFGALKAAVVAYVSMATVATVATFGLKAALVAVAAYAGYQFVSSISGASEAIEKLNKATKESERLNDSWTKRFTKNTGEILKNIESIRDPSEKKSVIERELQNAQKELHGYTKMVKESEDAFNEMNTRWNRWTATSAVNATNERLKDHQSRLELARTRVEQLNNALNDIKFPEADKELIGDIEKFTKELKQQIHTLGMTSDQVKLYEFRMRGASESMTAAAHSAMVLKVNLENLHKLVGKSTDLVKSLEDEIRFKGMESGAVAIERMREELAKLTREAEIFKRLNPDQVLKIAEMKVEIDKIRIAIQESEKLLKTQKEIEAIKKRSERASELNKEFRNPLETFRQSVKELDELLKEGLIGLETYQKAIEKSKKTYVDATKSANEFKKALSSINAVKFGSAEHEERFNEYRNTLEQQINEMERAEQQQKELNAILQESFNARMKDLIPVDDIRQELGNSLGEAFGQSAEQFRKQLLSVFREIETMRLKQVEETKKQLELDKILKGTREFNPPKFDPLNTFPFDKGFKIPPVQQPKNVPTPEFNVSSRADNTMMDDRKEMIRLLQAIDKTLVDIKAKPTSVLGVASVS